MQRIPQGLPLGLTVMAINKGNVEKLICGNLYGGAMNVLV